MVLGYRPADARDTVPAPDGDDGRHLHVAWLVPADRHRRDDWRDHRVELVLARVHGRVPGPVLAHPRAGRVDQRRAAGRREGMRPGLAGNPHPTLPGARATQHACRLDITAPAAGGEGTQAALRRADEGAGRRPGGGVGRRIERLAPQVEGIPGGTHPRAGTTCPTRRRPGRNGGGPTAMSAAAIGGWNDCSERGGCSRSATRRFLGKGPWSATPTGSRAASTR